MTEKELIRRAKQGDAAAFEQLMRLHGQFVYNLALRTLNNQKDAEDVTQETFLQLLKTLATFRGESQFRTWLYRIVINLCYQKLPQLKRELNLLEDGVLLNVRDEKPSIPDILLAEELKQQMLAAVQDLPEKYRLLITLRHLQGMSYAEIAEVTKMPLGTVKTGIFRARRELRLALRHLLKEGVSA
ncbi:RNA polymerase sigma factor [Candidatus Leptofilum sp.]|uniref:RNA polymerase sigma factor n=1 Tax=Candidatus Leptofilum sp. TaxID=3241576 RepID=UPI003B5B051C